MLEQDGTTKKIRPVYFTGDGTVNVWENPLRRKAEERAETTPFMPKATLQSLGFGAMLRGVKNAKKARMKRS